ncbi:hypothetical protein [Clostridium merdae]|uniref:hypothetical protein n=1 Tax=Clostridium merdae TaxID=1958780 RepID=UPI001FA82BFE|nr:hypothetical protein [Clostridium merdae]
MNSNQENCKHRYEVGYSFRFTSIFFRSVPCDHCGRSITLTWPWRILFVAVDLIGFILSYFIATSIAIPIFGSTLPVSLLIFVALVFIVQWICGFILKLAAWKEVEKSNS